jgi:murein DD-endopeptidase MepM/ murein hydrolase activator NlpD
MRRIERIRSVCALVQRSARENSHDQFHSQYPMNPLTARMESSRNKAIRRHLTAFCAATTLVCHACARAPVTTAPAPDAPPSVTPSSSPPTPNLGPSRSAADIAELLRAKELMIPVEGITPTRIADSYSARRGERIHGALDILAPRGTPVLSADAGRVWKIRSNPAGGLTVYALDFYESFVYYYAHLDRYADGLFEGMPLQPGEVIGYVGTTGNAPPNTPHLHFQLMRYPGRARWWDGEPINPFPYLVREGRARSP